MPFRHSAHAQPAARAQRPRAAYCWVLDEATCGYSTRLGTSLRLRDRSRSQARLATWSQRIPDPRPHPRLRVLAHSLQLLDGLVFSSLWAAGVAAALLAAVAGALGTPLPSAALALGFCGTFLVYNVDRLRDVARDRATAPARTAFVERHRRTLVLASAAAALGSVISVAQLPIGVALLCAPVLATGLLHRRIKHLPGWKTTYITFAWVAVCVGIPALLGGLSSLESAPTGVALGMPIAANLIVSNIRDRDGTHVPNRVAMGVALSLCGVAALACLGLGAALGLARGLAAIPALEALAIAGFASNFAQRDRERYGLAVVDGALLVGALATLGLLEAPL